DDLSSDSPSRGVDSDASHRLPPTAPGVGTVGVGTVTAAVTVATGVVTVAVGVVTPAFGTAAFGFGIVTGRVTGSFGFFGATPCHFAFHPASASRSRPSNPMGTTPGGARGMEGEV